jgi:type III secretion system YscQ/HrcQ family protein
MTFKTGASPETDESASSEKADPFAVDFFAQKDTVSAQKLNELAANLPIVEPETGFVTNRNLRMPVWYAILPKIPPEIVRASNDFSLLPMSLSEDSLTFLQMVLEQYVTKENGSVNCELIERKETNLFNESRLAETAQSVFISFAVEPDKSPAVLVMDTRFAAALIDLAFGGEGNLANMRRSLTKTELAVCEFLTLGWLNQMNQTIGKPFLQLTEISHETPLWLQTTEDGQMLKGFVFTLTLRMRSTAGLVRLLLPKPFLQALIATENPLLKIGNKPLAPAVKNLVDGIRFNLLAGETEIDSTDLLNLEYGDVVLVSSQMLEKQDGFLYGVTTMRIGRENGLWLGGIVKTSQEEGESPKISFSVQRLHEQKNTGQELTKIKMNANQMAEETEEPAVSLENIVLTVKVEMATRRMSLEEISTLRVGQTLELGCKPTDPINLTVEDKPVATGELIDVGGNLGVKITKVFV